MVSRLNPYLSFNGNARRAMEFYASVFGGKLAFNTFAEFGAEDSPDADLIMHGILETNAGYTLMAGDVTNDMEYRPMAGVSVSLSGDDADILRGYWEKLLRAGPSRCPCRRRFGVTSSACASTSSACRGWSMSASRRKPVVAPTAVKGRRRPAELRNGPAI